MKHNRYKLPNGSTDLLHVRPNQHKSSSHIFKAMSNFIFYFESSNKNANWRAFKKKTSVLETLNNINLESKNPICFSDCSIKIDEKTIKGYLLHDGISSDSLLTKNNITLYNFIIYRIKELIIIPNLILFFYNGYEFDDIIFNALPIKNIYLKELGYIDYNTIYRISMM